MNEDIKIIKSLENSGVLIDGVTETVKREVKKQEMSNLFSKIQCIPQEVLKKSEINQLPQYI